MLFVKSGFVSLSIKFLIKTKQIKMKKSILVLSAIAGIVYLTSCGGNEQPVNEISQSQLDSIKKATEDSIMAAEARAKDSLLNKMAEDSIAAANAAAAAAANAKPTSGSKPATKPATQKPTTPTEKPKTEKPSTIGNGKPSMKNDQGTIGSGKPSMKNSSDTEEKKVGNGKPSMK